MPFDCLPAALPLRVSPVTPADRILGAIAEIKRRGWCGGQFVDARGRVCLLGALGARYISDLAGDPEQRHALRLLALAIRAPAQADKVMAIANYNDGLVWFGKCRALRMLRKAHRLAVASGAA